MLMPKRTKFRKQMKGRNRGKATRGANLAMGEIGIKAVEAGRINSRQNNIHLIVRHFRL